MPCLDYIPGSPALFSKGDRGCADLGKKGDGGGGDCGRGGQKTPVGMQYMREYYYHY